jgi:hypothetical protein
MCDDIGLKTGRPISLASGVAWKGTRFETPISTRPT